MRSPRFTLAQWIGAVMVFGLLLALGRESPDDMIFLGASAFLFAGTAGACYAVSRLPYRTRIRVEAGVVVALLALSTWIWTPRGYWWLAAEADALSAVAAEAAARPGDPSSAECRHASAWFARRARYYRRKALWIGLTRGPLAHDYLRYHDSDAHVFWMILADARERLESRHDGPSPDATLVETPP